MERWENIKIIAGGQTGADRAALDWAMQHGIAHGSCGVPTTGDMQGTGHLLWFEQLNELFSV
jgi:hypothetical protein